MKTLRSVATERHGLQPYVISIQVGTVTVERCGRKMQKEAQAIRIRRLQGSASVAVVRREPGRAHARYLVEKKNETKT